MLPKEQWWSDEVKKLSGEKVFQQEGLKIYKARWFLSNSFSYDETQHMKTCQ